MYIRCNKTAFFEPPLSASLLLKHNFIKAFRFKLYHTISKFLINKNITALAATPVFLLVESAAMFTEQYPLPDSETASPIGRFIDQELDVEEGSWIMHSCIPTPRYKCVFQVELGCGK